MSSKISKYLIEPFVT